MNKINITFKAIRRGKIIYKNIPIYHNFKMLPEETFNGIKFPATSIEYQVMQYLDEIDKRDIMQVDHISSVSRSKFTKIGDSELNDVQNLFPSCRMCNYYKGTNDIEEFRNKIHTKLKETSVASYQTRLAIKYGMVILGDWDGLFFFEKCIDGKTDSQ